MLWSCLLALLFNLCLAAGDWPRFLGPAGNGSYDGQLAETWPPAGPAKVWQAEIGSGFAGPIVAGTDLFLFHRTGNEEKLECFDARTGVSRWASSYPATYRDDFGFDPGPRAVPTYANGRVFTYGPDGMIGAVAAPSGKTLWRVDARKEFGSRKGFFGRAPSPLVVGDLVLIQAGGPDGTIVALDVASGDLRWKAGSEEASYSSPALAIFENRTNAFFLTRSRFLALDPPSGRILFEYPFGPAERSSVTAATPLVLSNLVFLSACYGAGSTALQMDRSKPSVLWKSDDVMLNHYATCVARDGRLYGFDGRQERGPALACVDLATGRPLWRKENFGAGVLLLAGDRLLILLETGELILAKADPGAYRELFRAHILGSETRAYPALANGYFYARDKTKLACFDLRPR